jgi:hypothetical protein
MDFLAGGMEDLNHALVAHQIEKRLQIDPRRERVDHHRFVRTRKLRDAELRVIGRLAQEFGVDGDERMRSETFAGLDEILGGCDQIHVAWITRARAAS